MTHTISYKILLVYHILFMHAFIFVVDQHTKPFLRLVRNAGWELGQITVLGRSLEKSSVIKNNLGIAASSLSFADSGLIETKAVKKTKKHKLDQAQIAFDNLDALPIALPFAPRLSPSIEELATKSVMIDDGRLLSRKSRRQARLATV